MTIFFSLGKLCDVDNSSDDSCSHGDDNSSLSNVTTHDVLNATILKISLAVLILQTLVISAGCGLFFVCVAFNHSLRRSMAVSLASMMASDLFLTMAVPATTARSLMNDSYEFSGTVGALQSAAVLTYILNLMFFLFDKYTEIMFPFKHAAVMTRIKYICVVLLLWLAPWIIIIVAVRFTNWEHCVTKLNTLGYFFLSGLRYSLYVFVVPAMVVQIVMNFVIVSIARKHAKAIWIAYHFVRKVDKVHTVSKGVQRNWEERSKWKLRKFVIVAVCEITLVWLPALVVYSYEMAQRCTSGEVSHVLLAVFLGNAGVEPLLNPLCNSEWKRTVAQTFRKLKWRCGFLPRISPAPPPQSNAPRPSPCGLVTVNGTPRISVSVIPVSPLKPSTVSPNSQSLRPPDVTNMTHPPQRLSNSPSLASDIRLPSVNIPSSVHPASLASSVGLPSLAPSPLPLQSWSGSSVFGPSPVPSILEPPISPSSFSSQRPASRISFLMVAETIIEMNRDCDSPVSL